MTSHCLRPCYALMEEGEEEALRVRRTGSFQEMEASRWVEEGEVHSDRAAALDHGC